jgi:hypothetical protein
MNTTFSFSAFRSYILFTVLFGLCAFLLGVTPTSAAELTVSPSTGTHAVGGTFDVSVFLDTQGESINAIDLQMSFPPDKLQLVSPKTSLSIIEVWTSQPKFNNLTGTVKLQGGIPNGVNLSNALVATFTFRVKSVGQAVIKFSDGSRVLLNDGLGTDDLRQKNDAVFQLILPPPQGPSIASPTHPKQGTWYPNKDLIVNWAGTSGTTEYSYVLDRNPITIPDDIADLTAGGNSVEYSQLPDGVHYFHIKSRNKNAWGGTSHFSVSIDATAPAAFVPTVSPSRRTSSQQPVINFLTTDNYSGIDRYELRIIPLENNIELEGDQSLFIEVDTPYVTNLLNYGSYDVIVRAYDKAGNFREGTSRLDVVKGLLTFVGDEGLIIKNFITIPWLWLFIILGLIILGMWRYIHYLHKHHRYLLPGKHRKVPPHVKDELDQLQQYRRKYGALVILMTIVTSLFGFSLTTVAQATDTRLAPPVVETISQQISNDEIFYIGGTTQQGQNEIVLYLQNNVTGETFAFTTESNSNGRWFYRHESFLSPGRYTLWTQTKRDDQFSPPSAQNTLIVEETALSIGASRISYATLYGLMTLVFAAAILILAGYIVHRRRKLRRQRERFLEEVREAEESVRRGFAFLRKDIHQHLEEISRKHKNGELTYAEATEQERLILKDLQHIESKIGKEIWDVEHELTDNGMRDAE